MIVERLELRNWRNVRAAEVHFAPTLTLLSGANAQGKTNLLEAVFFLAMGRSHRTAHDQELVAFGADTAELRAQIRRQSGSFTLGARIRDGRSSRQREGKAYRRGQDPLGDFTAVLFAPEDLLALKGAPAERRRLLDLDLGQAYPSYRSAHKKYAQILRQRNALLRTYDRPPQELLGPWDTAWAESAVLLTGLRQRLVDETAPLVHRRSAEIASGEPVSLVYEPSLRAPSVEEALCVLEARRAEEMQRRTSLVGPHRDDLAMRIGERDLRLYGSQGEQRTALVAFKLAAIATLALRPGGVPVLLLDDVLSELDATRRRNLLEAATGAQTIVTTTEPGLAGMRPERGYTVCEGEYMRTW